MMFSGMSDLTATWLSPASLFIFINITIATIFLISRLCPHKTPYVADDYNSSSSLPPSLHRPPSFLSRIKSFNFSTYRFPLSDPDIDDDSAAYRLERTPSVLERVKSFNFYRYSYSPQSPETDCIEPVQQSLLSRAPSLLERVKSFYKPDSVKPKETELTGTDSNCSETGLGPVHGEVRRVQSEPTVTQRELSEKMKKSRRKVEKEEEEVEKTTPFQDEDHSVDAKADDFINKFKQQLKLQRLESILRHMKCSNGK
ncbi:hypothetical protein Goshw_000510 [Gossypium schwendimanii]|uniref:DUF4408 domain-containing protein n=1 Tax=Gossypium schwendimanii TaxID=34291 RepID=A0A7J9N3T1_GOSSC|nr:hypothetical protein [Gossypium schwendimanii]